MAVEAHHMSIFPPQWITSRECVKSEHNMNHALVDITGVPVTPAAAVTPDRQFSYGQSLVADPVAVAAAKACFNKSDSGLTYNANPSPAPRKRPRDSLVGEPNAVLAAAAAVQKRRSTGFGSLFDAELVSQIQQQQSEIDRFVAQQTEKLRLEIEERQRAQTRMLILAIQATIAKKLKEKDEEIVRMGKLNWVLQERVKSLFVENQIWRDLAQTNEATANNLRTNLEQVLAQVDGAGDEDRRPSATAAAAVEDDAESSCGSCDRADEVAGGKDIKVAGDGQQRTPAAARGGCRRCGGREASVLVLPCRHLCLCTVCGSALLQACPVCDTVMNASVHVNMS